MFSERLVPARAYAAKTGRALSRSYRRLYQSARPSQVYDKMQSLVIKLALAGVAAAFVLVTLLVH